MKIKNPIIRGCSPDPSICRKGEYYYLCNSSFSLFPGLPIYRSRDLCNWEQIGNAISRPSQLDFTDSPFCGGTFAPTFRYHNGKFYIINAFHCANGGGYYITADDPAGEWSDPIFCLTGHGDPEFFFDDDGKVYHIAVRGDSTGKLHYADNEVFGREFDLETNEYTSDPFTVWNGALQKSMNLEGPHMYKKDGYYYILAAEGGTGEEHSVVIARSENIRGPYEPCPFNPIVTHRHFGGIAPFHCVGHADMFEGADGNWYMVMLGSRKYKGYTFMGRETLFAKVDWIDGWPYINRGYGMIPEEIKIELPQYPVPTPPSADYFTDEKLPLNWVQLRASEPHYTLTDKGMSLKTRPEKLGDTATPSYMAQRQREFFSVYETSVSFNPASEHECAGLAYLRTETLFIRFEIGKDSSLRVVECIDGIENTVYTADVKSNEVQLRMVVRGLTMNFEYKTPSDADFVALPIVCDLRNMTNEREITFLGNLVGVYTSSNGHPSDNYALFRYFKHCC